MTTLRLSNRQLLKLEGGALMLATVKPYDPADSPGPIPSVVEHFRPRTDRPERLTGPAAEAARYTVLLIPPESTDPLGHDRDDPGLKLYCDDEYDCDLSSLYEAAKLIEEQCKAPVTLIEHHADLTYWTAHLRAADSTP